MWITIHRLYTGLSPGGALAKTLITTDFIYLKNSLSTYPQVPTTTTTIYIYIY